MRTPVKPSWLIPLASFVTMILAMVGDTIHPGIEVDQAHIETLLMMLLGSGAIGAANSMHKRKTVVEKPKEEPSTVEVQEEIAEKVEEEVEKAKEEIKQVGKRAIQKAVIETTRILKAPERLTTQQFDSLNPLQQDQFTSTGGMIDNYQRETTGIRWNNTSKFIDTTLDSDPEKGPVFKQNDRFLYVRVIDALSGHTLQLFDEAGNLLQVDQKGPNEISKLVMRTSQKSPYPVGNYKLVIVAMTRGTSYAQSMTTHFEIVP